MVEIRHFRALAAVVDTGTFSAAARVLHMTQPAVSRVVAQLERHFDTELLDRSQQPLRLTDHGAQMLPAVLRALAAFDEVLEAPLAGKRALRLGFGWLGCDEHDTRVIAEFEARNPAWTVSVRCSDSHMAGLDDGSVDIAVLRCEPDPGRYTSRLLRLEERIIALPSGHELAHRDSVRLGDLRGETLVATMRPGTGFVNKNLMLWREHNPNGPIVAVRNVREWLNEIALGRGVGFASAPVAGEHLHSNVRFVPLVDVDPVEVLLAWPTLASRVNCTEFITIAMAYAEDRLSVGLTSR